jgi:hypothetical protein
MDIKEKCTDHWPTLPSEPAGNRYPSFTCKYTGTACCTKAKTKLKQSHNSEPIRKVLRSHLLSANIDTHGLNLLSCLLNC